MYNKEIVNEYEKNYLYYEKFRGLVEDYIRSLLNNEHISFHSITSRTKNIDSLTKKIELKNKYQKLQEITDLVGIRIITYYSDTVDQISKLIEKRFVIDRDNSIDKRKTIDPDRFGYRSLHYVVQINNGQIQFNTDFNYYDLKFEIQISSILQYTWAEIEHDLGYKSQEEIPYDIKRSFSRLASLLELADEEFLRIKNEIFAYKNQLMLSYLSAKLDKESLNVFKIKSPEFIDLISFFIKELEAKKASQGNFKNIISMLKYLNLKTLQEVDNRLKQYHHLIKKYAYVLYEDTTRSNLNVISGDIPLLYLCYFILVIEKSEDEFEKFTNQFISSNAFKKRLIKLKSILKNV
ncbi:hypothetical protein CWE04_00820 [Thomasclavelia cocleata]|uniref:PpGpp synthetase catalytic domain-containing protein (RelA/SpoT-type nucleotidyltranferase) n=1 Tax=Thomasclavelia cocleata TaxID=69824 RepID=A0A1I0HDQ3_9FIRM|nr:hypothetical protein [Thomasclavelia cocleata]MCR1960513.1 hypothetical protein [Thomasclavelia cocleata]NDO41481.1 hypothetical protein [Thomasclavelia cocleata]PJN81698.1 hypothetical protein CWE04_00820 [Thomasclavelia cocleata]SET82034.1 ppGpp synthetase catalytic domain-containing protein (RelA/SpoT-type nucleotidyltranferase) [Thomasclavelia cocleata]